MPADASVVVDAVRLKETVQEVPEGAAWAAHLAACRELDEIESDRVPDALRARVAIVGSSTLQPLVSFLRVEGARAGFWLEVYLAPYGQYLQELLDPGSELYSFERHATFLMVGGEALWEMRWARSDRVEDGAFAEALLASLRPGLDAFAAHGTGALFVNELTLPLNALEAARSSSPASFPNAIRRANDLLAAELAERQSCYLFPLADLIGRIGRERALDARMRYRGDVLWTDAFMARLARRYAGLVGAVRGRATKCLVLDLDNTLWGGVLGEEGSGGIVIGPERPGREFLDFQRQLLELQRQGILLAVCSKNNEHEVLEIFRNHPTS